MSQHYRVALDPSDGEKSMTLRFFVLCKSPSTCALPRQHRQFEGGVSPLKDVRLSPALVFLDKADARELGNDVALNVRAKDRTTDPVLDNLRLEPDGVEGDLVLELEMSLEPTVITEPMSSSKSHGVHV